MSYEHEFRLIGRWMDQRHPDHIQLVETPEGFAAFWQWGHDIRAAIGRQFAHHDFISLERQARTQRDQRHGTGARPNGSSHPKSYEDLLRALGHELDAASAETVLIEELDDGFLVTYQYRDPGDASTWRKHMAVLVREQAQRLIKQATARRQLKVGLAARLG
jgi:hypothetical protein